MRHSERESERERSNQFKREKALRNGGGGGATDTKCTSFPLHGGGAWSVRLNECWLLSGRSAVEGSTHRPRSVRFGGGACVRACGGSAYV